jgi:undecaprenyl-diphosphatase
MNAIVIFGAKYLIYFLIASAVYCFFTIEKSRRRELFIFATTTLVLAYILAKISSFLYYDPRPFVIGNFVPLIQHVADNGFPSDHMLLASTVALIVFRFKRKWGIFLFALAFIVGISRVFAGVHHLVDIFGSIVVSVASYYIVCGLTERFILRKK